MIQLTNNLAVILVAGNVSWSARFPNLFTYQTEKSGVSETFYVPILEYNKDIRVHYEIVGSITKLGEFDFDCKNYVEEVIQDEYQGYKHYHNKQFMSEDDWCSHYTEPKESFISLLQSKGIFLEKLDNQKILILEKQ